MMGTPKTLEKMKTGVPGLDHLLEGGIVRGNSMLVEGPPGSGKTTIAIRIAYEGVIQFGEPALIVTFEEFPRQIYEECLSCGVDLEAQEKKGLLRVIWTPPGRILEGFSGKNDLVDKIISEMGIRRLVIDSITHFKRVAVSEVDLREALGQILNYLKIRGINSFLVKELERLDDETIAFEEYLVDASMRIYNSRSEGGGENMRTLELRKTRGQGHVSGHHPFRLGSGGVTVYPHLRPRDVVTADSGEEKAPEGERVGVGIRGLDSMLCGGLLQGSLNLVIGFPGSGKTVAGLHFLDTGLQAGENCLMVTTNNAASQVVDQAASLGMDWREAVEGGRLGVANFHPVGLCVDEMMNLLLQHIRELRPSRFVFDSLDGLWSSLKDQDLLRDYVLVLIAMLRGSNTTSILVNECRDMGGLNASVHDFSQLASCLVQLSIAEADGELRRFVGIAKHVGSDHAKELREVTIDGRGMHVRRKAAGLSGILSGQTSGAMEDVADKVMGRLEEITKAIHELAASSSLPDGCGELANSAALKLNLVDVVLREHFGLTDFHSLVDEALESESESVPG